MGGWQTRHTLGYALPSYEALETQDGGYELRALLVLCCCTHHHTLSMMLSCCAVLIMMRTLYSCCAVHPHHDARAALSLSSLPHHAPGKRLRRVRNEQRGAEALFE